MGFSSPRPYPSDLTDEQWALIEPMVSVKPGGRPAIHLRRRIVEAILYLDRTGCSWRSLPQDFPPWDTVYWYFQRWNADGTTEAIHDALRAAVRDAAGKDPLPVPGSWTPSPSPAPTPWGPTPAGTTPAIMPGGLLCRVRHKGKKINGCKRHIVTDTLGLLVVVLVTVASMQDRDGAGWCWAGRRW